MTRLILAMLALASTFHTAQAQPYQQQPTAIMPSRQELYNSMVPPPRPGDGQQRTQTVCERVPTGQVVCNTR